MKMNYDGTLVLPKNYVAMDEEEMEYLEAGMNLKYNQKYLKKSYCKETAFCIINQFRWGSICVDTLAKEIYAHARIFYSGGPILIQLKNLGIGEDIYRSVMNGIDIEDKVDSRQKAFDLIWRFL